MAFLFWTSFALIGYTYLGYPLLLAVLQAARPRPVAKGVIEPVVSVVLAVHNEAANIGKRLDNLLEQDYPARKLEIVVVSDGSEDGTANIARAMAGERVRVVELASRQGKAAALNAGVQQASGEIVVFCDARQSFEPNCVRELVSNFADTSVGCVSGELMLHKGPEEGLEVEVGGYWRYEKWIRRAESASGSVIGATGAICAVRRCLYRELPVGTLLDDVMTPMNVVMQGYRTVFDGTARAHDVVSQHLSQERVRKVRTLAGNWQLMALMPALLVPWRNPCWIRFVSHKFLRLVVPVALALLLRTAAVIDGPLYKAALAAQLLFYGLALAGGAVPAARKRLLVNLSYFFVVMNFVAVAGFWRWVTGRSNTAWRPAYAEKRR